MKSTKNILAPVIFSIVFANSSLATQIEPPPEGKARPVQQDLFELHMFPGWFQPLQPLRDETQHKGSSRLLVKLHDGSAIINPPEEELAWSSSGSFLPLAELTWEDAKKLWGEPRGTTFDLLCDSRAEKDVYHLDTKFAKERLASYRLRGIGIVKPEWVSVSKKEVDEQPDAAHRLPK